MLHPDPDFRLGAVACLGVERFSRLHNFFHGTTLSISRRNCSRRVGLRKRSKSPAAKVCCFIEIRPL
jgi:hypothetical protein